jgi:hypothetical protein
MSSLANVGSFLQFSLELSFILRLSANGPPYNICCAVATVVGVGAHRARRLPSFLPPRETLELVLGSPAR